VALVAASASGAWLTLKNAGGNVNSTGEEITPFAYLEATATTVYFASTKNAGGGGAGGYDIYSNTRIGTGWSWANWLETPLNTSANEVSPWLNSTRTRIYIASDRPGGYGKYDLWTSNKSGDFWLPCTNLGPSVNTADVETHPFGNVSGNVIYFTSDRTGGFGGYDIYTTTNLAGQWQTPVNIGYRVNSTYGEWSPSLSGDGLRLYFHSDRPGYGGSDVWVSEYVGGTWQPALNVGTVVNSTLNEQDPTVTTENGDDTQIYLSIYNKTGGRGGFDIWYSTVDATGVEPTSLGRVKAFYR